MVHFDIKLFFFALGCGVSTQATKTYLRTPVSPSSDHHSLFHRNLSYEMIASYSPRSQVTDHNAIDLDQLAMEQQLALQTESSFVSARAIYERGAHSRSYAILTITSGTTPNESDGTLFSGLDTTGVEVTGMVYESEKTPAGELWLQYSTSDNQDSYVRCQVGALAITGSANTNGCFAPSGTVSSGTRSYTYEYVPLEDNKNGRTIKGFSTSVKSKMLDCPSCPYTDAGYFVSYYGNPDYADKWINAALVGGKTDFISGRGNADFKMYNLSGRAEAVKKGTAYMAIFMYVIREFEDALDDCQIDCIACNDEPVHAWDEGVAFYSGSLEGADGTASGLLLHQLADKRCPNFGTCVDEDQSKSAVNAALLNLFNIGQSQLLKGQCEEARETKNKIVNLMYIPLIQGTIRYAYKVGEETGGEKDKAEGATFAAAVLPRIYAANKSAADIIYSNMRVGASSTDFVAVKKAFESVYSDLNIKCSDVGGLLDPEGGYYPGAAPCSDAKSNRSQVAVGASLGSIAGIALIAGVLYISSKRRQEKKRVREGMTNVPTFQDSVVKEVN